MANTTPQWFLEYRAQEDAWIDEVIHGAFPKWLTNAAERNNWFARYVLSPIMAWPFRMESSKDIDFKSGKGFRAGHGVQTLRSITTKVTRYGKPFAEKKFIINGQIT